MSEPTPKQIICAVRGSPQSRETVTRAIDMALESGAHLTFFYVVDAGFHAQAAMGGRLSVIYQELISMAEFTMIILCDRARRRGIEHTDYVIREGNVRKQLLQLATETHADVLVMGWPLRGPGRPTFKPKEFDAFVRELEHVARPQLVIAPPVEEEKATKRPA